MARQTSLNAIDIGSNKISCLISIPSEDSEKINVVGVATTPSRGVRKGLIVDIEEAVGAITDCVEAAERMAGFSINSAYVSISGDHIQSQNSKGVVAITQPEGEIDQEDVYGSSKPPGPFHSRVAARSSTSWRASISSTLSGGSRILSVWPESVSRPLLI